MRALVYISLTVLLTAAVGWGVCQALGVDPHPRDMALAGAICLLACSAASVPLVLTRHASQLAVTQAALVGTMVHLFGMLGLAAVVVFARLAGYGSFLYWLMAFYFATLPVLVIAFVPFIRTAPPHATGKH